MNTIVCLQLYISIQVQYSIQCYKNSGGPVDWLFSDAWKAFYRIQLVKMLKYSTEREI